MKPSFLEGALLAAVVSLAGTMLYHLFRPIYGGDVVLQGLSATLGLAYVLYLIGRSRLRGGRVSILACWLLGACLIAWLSPSVLVSVCGHLALIWVVRACTYHKGLLPALADFCLSGCSLLAAAWAVSQTQSLFAGLWCLMLVQALFSLIPARAGIDRAQASPADEDRFETARRHAEEALRALSTVR